MDDADASWLTLKTRCGIENCRTRRVRRDPTDGHLYCKHGHQQPLALESQIEEIELIEQGASRKKTKRAKGAKGADGDHSDYERAPEALIFEGRQAGELFLQCYQLVLRRQVWFLIHKRDMPAQLEDCVRGLWAAKLQLLDLWLMDFLGEHKELEAFVAASTGGERPRDSQDRLFSSQGDTSTTYRTGKLKFEAPRPEDTLVLCYFACILLRAPIMIRDVLEWIKDPEFGYGNMLTALPRSATLRLPLNWRRRFNNRANTTTASDLHIRALQLAARFAQPLLPSLPQIMLPELNIDLLLGRLVKELSLPAAMFEATLKLANILGITWRFPDEQHRAELQGHPELKLIALLVIAVKLSYPFDGVPRVPLSEEDSACARVDWKVWNDLQKDLPRSPAGRSGSHAGDGRSHWDTTPRDVVTLDDEHLDEYLDWFQDTWLNFEAPQDGQGKRPDVQPNDGFEKALFDLFPTAREPSRSSTSSPFVNEQPQDVHDAARQRAKIVTSSLIVRSPASKPGNMSDKHDIKAERRRLRPGADYKRYKRIDDVEPEGQMFMERCAWLIGGELELLIRAVRAWEGKVCRWCESRQREAKRAEDRP